MRFSIRLLLLAVPLVLLQPALAEDEADVSVRVSSQAREMAAGYQLPAQRNAIVLLLSRQEEASVSSGAGPEAIRAEALAELRSSLEEEQGNSFIEDVMFTTFIVQR